jgi:DNA processing protein
LRSGATLTETTTDIITQLGPLLHGAPLLPRQVKSQRELPLTAAPTIPAPIVVDEDTGLGLILEKLSPTPVAVDELVRQCQLSAAAVASLLLELELAGRIERHPGNLVSRR